MPKLLFVGESSFTTTTHLKGYDAFSNVDYLETGGDFVQAVTSSGWEVEWIKSHEVFQKFPASAEQLAGYDAVAFSDIGANSFQLSPRVHIESQTDIDRLAMVRDYVRMGGGFVLFGGYMSYCGIEGRARYGATPIADIMPVRILEVDDRREAPSGIRIVTVDPQSPIVGGVSEWPTVLGYNFAEAKPETHLHAQVEGGDPLLVTGQFGAGRSAAFLTDVAPHWLTPEFMEWEQYPTLWGNLLNWVSGRG